MLDWTLAGLLFLMLKSSSAGIEFEFGPSEEVAWYIEFNDSVIARVIEK